MRLIIKEDFDAMSDWAARYVKQRINQFNPTADKPFVLGLPTGSTPIGLYKRLAEYHAQGELSFKNVVTFNMDEYVGLDAQHAQSYHKFMWDHLFKHVDIKPENVHILNGTPEGYSANLDLDKKIEILERECSRYEEMIQEAGGIDLFIGGIGPDGHIAFNEPGSSLVSRTRIKSLAKETIIANKRFFPTANHPEGDMAEVPTMSLTVGVGTYMDAREVMVLISGQNKAVALTKCLEEGVSHMWTVSAVQMHRKSIIVCDTDATAELRVKTVTYFKGLEEVHNKMLGELSQSCIDLPTASTEGAEELTSEMKLELMQGIKALEGGDAKYSEISSMCLINEHVVARAVQQNQNLSGAEKWQEVHNSLVGLKAQIKEQQKFAASQSKPPAVAKPPSTEPPAVTANNDSIIPMLSFGVACAGLALGLAAFLKK